MPWKIPACDSSTSRGNEKHTMSKSLMAGVAASLALALFALPAADAG